MRFEVENVAFDTDSGLSIGGECVHLPPRVHSTLRVLLVRHDQVVSRDELKREVWPDAHVEDNSVTQAVKAVRRALAGTRAAERIKTVPRRGYSFTGPVTTSPSMTLPAGPRIAGQERSLPTARWLHAGFAVCGLAAALCVAILAVADHLSETARSATLYEEGQSLLATRRAADLREAESRFAHATAADPANYEALTALAQTRYLLGFYGLADRDAMRLAERAADEAVRLDPSRPTAYAVRASIALDSRWDLTASARDFALALRLDPDDPLTRHWAAWWCLAAGRLEDARALLDSAVRLEPFSPMLLTARGTFAYLEGDFVSADRDARRALTIDPNFFRAHLRLGLIDLLSGRHASGIERLVRARSLAPDVPEVAAALAHGHALAGQSQRARRILHESHGLTDYDRAVVLTGLGQHRQALDALAAAKRNDRLVPGLFVQEPRLAPLRVYPEFQRLHAAIRRAADFPVTSGGFPLPSVEAPAGNHLWSLAFPSQRSSVRPPRTGTGRRSRIVQRPGNLRGLN